MLITPIVCASPNWTNDQITDAIYMAEGGAGAAMPYGIMKHYRHTTARQACINTIEHARRDCPAGEDLIAFLQKRYCPIGAENDPMALNRYWLKNVRWFLEHPVEVK